MGEKADQSAVVLDYRAAGRQTRGLRVARWAIYYSLSVLAIGLLVFLGTDWNAYVTYGDGTRAAKFSLPIWIQVAVGMTVGAVVSGIAFGFIALMRRPRRGGRGAAAAARRGAERPEVRARRAHLGVRPSPPPSPRGEECTQRAVPVGAAGRGRMGRCLSRRLDL